MKKAYDATHPLTYGYYRCEECKAEFYGGGTPLHERGCTKTDYASCTYVFGPNENTRWVGAVVTAEEMKGATHE